MKGIRRIVCFLLPWRIAERTASHAQKAALQRAAAWKANWLTRFWFCRLLGYSVLAPETSRIIPLETRLKTP